MAKIKGTSLQPYPRRQPDDYLADDSLFPRPAPLATMQLDDSIKKAFERSLKNNRGETVRLKQTPKELVAICLKHLKERSDPILAPAFLAQCPIEEIFEMDAIAHEMQRHRMKMGDFYQYLVLELIKHRYPSASDGTEEGDVKVDIETPEFDKGLRLHLSVKKSKDTVGGQDVKGMIERLESVARKDQGRDRPYLCVACVATPPGGKLRAYEESREIRRNKEKQLYSANFEVWLPGFIFPFISGLEPNEVYKAALAEIGKFLPFYALSQRKECSELLVKELNKLSLIDENTGRIAPDKFQAFITQTQPRKE